MLYTNHFSKMIQFHRKESGLSRDALARISGVGKTVIYDIEHGKSTVKFATIIRILQALNIQLDFQSALMAKFEDIESNAI